MKVRIELTDESGQRFEGEVHLNRTTGRTNREAAKSALGRSSIRANVDLDLPIRPFLKGIAKGRSGAAKLTLLIAHLTKGKPGVPVKFTDIERAWNNVTGLLGPFNPAHTTRAKDEGWVDSPAKGEYVLLTGWQGATR